jgi:hypothetical protein
MDIRDLPNFGTKSQAMLAQAGFASLEQLRELGSVAAYLRVKQSGAACSLNLLWAIEGAISGRHWQEVAKQDRLRLLLELEVRSDEIRHASKKKTATKLEDIPNIGKSIAADLRGIGILNPQQLAKQDPLALYLALADRMGQRHDPCVLYTFMAAKHFLQSGESRPWWKFTQAGKRLLSGCKGIADK